MMGDGGGGGDKCLYAGGMAVTASAEAEACSKTLQFFAPQQSIPVSPQAPLLHNLMQGCWINACLLWCSSETVLSNLKYKYSGTELSVNVHGHVYLKQCIIEAAPAQSHWHDEWQLAQGC